MGAPRACSAPVDVACPASAYITCSASPSEAGSFLPPHQSLMPQQGHDHCKSDADTVCDGRAQSASGGGDEGAVPPQIPLPPASGLLSCSRRQAHTPVRGRACGFPSPEGAMVRRERERPSVPFHPAPGLVIKDGSPARARNRTKSVSIPTLRPDPARMQVLSGHRLAWNRPSDPHTRDAWRIRLSSERRSPRSRRSRLSG